MPNETVDWIRLDDAIAAADRGLAPLSPELAGFIVLETAQRLRELGGVLDAGELAIGTTGHVALTAPPSRGDEELATRTLRTLLARLLAAATSATPALRQCSKRRDHGSLVALCRELEAALIPMNRAASRRAVARIARATLEAIDNGRLEPAGSEPSDSEPPPVEVAPRPCSTAPTAARREPTPEPNDVDEATPYCAPQFDEEQGSRAAVDSGSPADFEVVSHLPPITSERFISDRPPLVAQITPHPTFTFTVEPRKDDRVARLIESFEVSRLRDDPTLARDLKAIAGVESHAPPAVTVHVRLRPRAPRGEPRNDEIRITAEPMPEPAAAIAEPEPDSETEAEPLPVATPRRRTLFAIAALGAAVSAILALAARPATLDALLGPPLPPPGDTPAVPATGPASLAPAHIPMVCEASMTLEGAPSGAEVLRRVGTTPLTVTMPMHVPFDLVATMEGHAPRRAHVDASALWQKEPTGARLEVPFALDSVAASATDAKWPAASGVVPLRAQGDAPRGLLRATSTPNGATLWIVVDPAAVTAVPCGASVELLVVSKTAQKTVRVDWAAFAGSPPRATAKY